jgi:hypothetical protein
MALPQHFLRNECDDCRRRKNCPSYRMGVQTAIDPVLKAGSATLPYIDHWTVLNCARFVHLDVPEAIVVVSAILTWIRSRLPHQTWADFFSLAMCLLLKHERRGAALVEYHNKFDAYPQMCLDLFGKYFNGPGEDLEPYVQDLLESLNEQQIQRRNR